MKVGAQNKLISEVLKWIVRIILCDQDSKNKILKKIIINRYLIESSYVFHFVNFRTEVKWSKHWNNIQLEEEMLFSYIGIALLQGITVL